MTEVSRVPTPHPVPENWPADGIHHQPDPNVEPEEGTDEPGRRRGHIDNTLPGDESRPGHPDQGLPGGSTPHPDHELPGTGTDPHPDQGLPGGRPARPDQGLPETPGPKRGDPPRRR